jgi:hypothetical protein
MKLVPSIPGHFTVDEWIALGSWIALGVLASRKITTDKGTTSVVP